MYHWKFILTVALVVLLFLSACHIARGTSPTPQVSGDNEAEQKTLIAFSVQQTQTAQAVVPPLISPFPTETPSITLSPTPQVPTVTVSVATNCRTGPGTVYPMIGALAVGATAEVVGRSASSDNWIVKLPGTPTVTCWLWGYYATVVGDTSSLPVIQPPPTPTPIVGYELNYVGMVSCGGLYAFRFSIVNDGSLTWESVRLVITDNTTATTFTHTLDGFRDYDSCIMSSLNDDLSPGETGNTANVNPGHLAYNPTGHSITAVVTVCSEEGLGGTCISKTLNFTP